MSNLKQNKAFLLLLLIATISIPLAIIPNIISPSVEEWCKQYLGENYIPILTAFFVVGTFLVVFLTTSIPDRIFPNRKQGKLTHKTNIAWTPQNIQLIEEARKLMKRGLTERALEKLSQIENDELKEKIAFLTARFATYRSNEIAGTNTFEQKDVSINRINKETLLLIGSLEEQQSEGKEYIQKIKSYLKERYENRLNQKLAGRQPVNLRQLTSTEGTSEETAAAFVAYPQGEIRTEINQLFKDAYGRLLIIGVSGSGKTTLLLQLELSLLESKKNALPVVLNLATWNERFTSIESWLEEILPAELGVNKALAKKVVSDFPLILLLDGFDEIEESQRKVCMEAIGKYSAKSQHQFAITSRKEEYKKVVKDAPVNSQIEVGVLTIQQIEAELERIGHQQPEAMPLLQALKRDTTLSKAVQTPFYFNALQLLFANGKRMNDLDFKADDTQGRQNEIRDRFVEMVTEPIEEKGYDREDIKRWMSFLAQGMNKNNLVVFELIDLQYDWWDKWTEWQKGVTKSVEKYKFLLGLILIVHFCMSIVFFTIYKYISIQLLFNDIKSYIESILLFVIFIFFTLNINSLNSYINRILLVVIKPIRYLVPMKSEPYNYKPKILTKDKLYLSSYSYIKEVKYEIINAVNILIKIGLSFIAFFFITIGIYLIGMGILFILEKFIDTGWIYQNLKIIEKEVIDTYNDVFFTKKSRQDMKSDYALLRLIKVYLLFTPIIIMIKVGYNQFMNSYYSFIQINKPYQRFTASIRNFHFSIFQHFHLRYHLKLKKVLPFRLVTFLNTMTQNHLLESDGATWSFRHRILQDYFANLWEEKYTEQTTKKA